jgi:hypothetical protein
VQGAHVLRLGNAEHGAAQVLDLAVAQGDFELVLPDAGATRSSTTPWSTANAAPMASSTPRRSRG